MDEIAQEVEDEDNDVDVLDTSEIAWLKDGLTLQMQIRKAAKPKKTPMHKRKYCRRTSVPTTPTTTSLYPEVPIVDEARQCAENFGSCSLEQLQSVQHREFSLLPCLVKVLSLSTQFCFLTADCKINVCLAFVLLLLLY